MKAMTWAVKVAIAAALWVGGSSLGFWAAVYCLPALPGACLLAGLAGFAAGSVLFGRGGRVVEKAVRRCGAVCMVEVLVVILVAVATVEAARLLLA